MAEDTDSVSITPSIGSTESKEESRSDTVTASNTKSKPTKKSKSRKSRKRKKPDDDPDGSIPSPSTTNNPPTKRRKKRGWDEDEERRFREGLDEYGRDWKAIAVHVGNERNASSIRSHAQVYFLKLLAERQSLPEKVKESGTGYTLSGGPLNKYSSIAVRQFGGADNVPMIEGVVSDEEAANKNKRKKKESTDSASKSKPSKNKKSKKAKKRKNKYYDSSDDEEELYGFSSMTVTASSSTTQRRSGRVRARRCVRGQMALHETDPFGLRTDIELYAPFGGKEEATRKRGKWSGSCSVRQPFGIKYCPNALVLADIHCHLCLRTEVMGLLGGDYDRESGVMFIRKCVPLREEEQGEHSVAADASHHLAVIEALKEEGMQCLGWYHSHPQFENVPSNTDCHQHFVHKYPDETENPYIGLIVASWSSPDVASGVSHFRFFNSTMESSTSYTPFECRTETKVGRSFDDKALMTEIDDVIERYSATKYDILRSDLGENWSGTQMTKMDKILKSIKGHIMMKEDGDDEEMKDENIEDDDDDKMNESIQRIRNMFVRRAAAWFMTNRPSKEEIEDAVNEKVENK